MIELIKRADWLLNGVIIFLSSAGMAVLASSSPELFTKQLIFFLAGIVFVLIAPIFDLRHLVNYRWLILTVLAISVLMLLSVHIFGVEVNGSKSWIDMGFFSLQPSEFAKVALILVLSAFFSRRHVSIKRPSVILGSFAYFIVPAALILMEPDLGSALIFFGIWFGFLLVAGLPVKYIAAGLIACAMMGIFAWNFGMKDYQRNRIMAVFDPESDPLGVNYNVIQSKNAIGSAGLFGKGFKQGAIVQLGFLPAAQTDFAFASFTEEWGIIGGSLALLAYGTMMWRIAAIGAVARSNFNKFMCLGTMIFLGLQFAVNMGSVIGFTPVIGVAFPFLSAGGSNMMASMFLVGIVQNIAVRRNA
jgi:rod shape determining protein RodA